jgi:hypothetical protein
MCVNSRTWGHTPIMEDKRNADNPRERNERELIEEPAERSEKPAAQREPGREEAAEEHLRRPGDDAFSDDEMVERARK